MDQSRIWDYFQNAGADSFRGARPRLAFLAGRIAKGADVLDIGIGDGTFERIALARGLRVHVIDPDAKAMLKEFNNLPMPNQNLSDAEIRQYLQYFHWFDAQPAGTVTSSGAGH